MLSEEDIERYTLLKIPKKKTEWLAGRIAAKLALSHAFGVPFTQIEILKDINRSPYSIINNIKIHVSITHSNGIALSTIDDLTIDLELIAKRNPAFIREAFSLQEIEKYNLYNAEDKLITTLWTIKESHLKRMRIGLKTDLHGVFIETYLPYPAGQSISDVVSTQGRSQCLSIMGNKFVVTVARP